MKHLGTLLWSAPEVLNLEAQSQRSDSWSFACLAVELFSEKDPYFHEHGGDQAKIKRVIRKVEDRQLVRREAARSIDGELRFK